MRRPFAALSANAKKDIKASQALAATPALCLIAYWLGGETALVCAALGLTIILVIYHLVVKSQTTEKKQKIIDFAPKDHVISSLDSALKNQDRTGKTTACLVISIDEFPDLIDALGTKAADTILVETALRVSDVLRENDVVARLNDSTFAIALSPIRQIDLELLIQLSTRIQAAIAEPLSIDAAKIYTSASIGFCLPTRAPIRTGEALITAAEKAMLYAKSHGSASIRAYSSNLEALELNPRNLHNEVAEALEKGEIIPWFQPQICTSTGAISGMEALARWIHPQSGLIPPNDFIPALEKCGLMERLGETILQHALIALTQWDKAGFNVPTVSVNFSAAELANPKLVEKIEWALDRFELAPSRLTVEILEDVIASAEDDSITRNIWALNKLGCGIDLDDFGTGHASIANIRRFAVKRIKIDRSYITRCDTDRDQQNMLAAILTMAERIDLDTIAEGIETTGEHAMLAQLGCGHVQGFSISRPIAFDKTLAWMHDHNKKTAQLLCIGREAG